MSDFIQQYINEMQSKIDNIPDNLKQDYVNYIVSKILEKNDNNDVKTAINYFFEIKKVAGNLSLDKTEKIKYNDNKSKIILIAQYYHTDDPQRHKENSVSLLNNIINPNIDKIHLLNEKSYDLSHILDNIDKKYSKKIKEHIIEKRMTYHDAIAYANTFCKNDIIIIANLDIFFTDKIDVLKTYDYTNLFLSMSRFELLNDFKFDGNNSISKFIHNGQLGNPCIDSHDAWIFKSPIKLTNSSKIMLGSLGCDTALNYIYGEELKYNVINPIDSVTTIHYHRERERDYRTENKIRTHSGIIYNSNQKYDPDNYKHKYIIQKNIVVCNTIESFCTFATKNAYKDLRLLLHSLEIYHSDIPIFIYCDSYIASKIDNYNFNLKIYKKIELDKYKDLNRQGMEELNIFTEFLLNKANVIDFAMETYSNTLFIDADIVILNKMDLLIDKSYDVGLSPHNIFEKSQKMFGVYNAGFMYVVNKNITNYWKHIIKTKKGFDDQQALDYFEDEFKVFKFDDSYNFGWWRLLQCENPQERADLFGIEGNIYYAYKTLKCIHTHLYETKDQQTLIFNKFILSLLGKINHPMMKFIKNENITNNTKNTENNIIENNNTENNNTKNNNIENNNTSKPIIIIPKMPRDDFWQHNNDTFRELVLLWKENNLCNVLEADTKHVWYNKIDDILLYDRPTLDWLHQDTQVSFNKILFGNPLVPDNLKDKASNWIFWGRSPIKLNHFANMEKKSYKERRLESIFIGKIENNIQLHFRTMYPDIEKTIQLYIMHKPDEKYKYNQDEYLDLLRNSKFGLSLRGFGPKCNREIELMALGTVPIVAFDVDMTYYNSPIENKHFFRFNKVEDIKKIIENCSESQWESMSNACIEWYNTNCEPINSFHITQKIIQNLNKNNNKENNKNNNKENNKNNNNENIKQLKKGNIKQLKKGNIEDNIICRLGSEQSFTRENLKSYFNIDKILKNNKDIPWDNINKFEKTQSIYIAKFENIKINGDVMYNDIYYSNLDKIVLEKKKLYKFDENTVVFNCLHKNGNNYYNWLCEIYPKIFYIKVYLSNNKELFDNKQIVFLLHQNDFIEQCLEILSFDNIKVHFYDSNVEYLCETVYLVTPTHINNPSRESIQFVRKNLFNNNILVPRINILIKDQINNIEEIYSVLKNKYKNPWVIFDKNDYNIIKTIQLFSQANLVIGVTGNELANILFCSDKTKVIELKNNNNLCYWHLCNIIKIEHTIIPFTSDINIEQLDYTIDKVLNTVFSLDNI